MTLDEITASLKQRFPMLMIDSVVLLEPGKRIRAVKNATANELESLGHFPGFPCLPETLLVEAMGQAASVLFTQTTGAGAGVEEFLVLGAIPEMEFCNPVVPGDRVELDVTVSKLIGDFALVSAVATVKDTIVARGKIGFAKRSLASL